MQKVNITKKNIIIHINIDIQLEGIRTITTIKEIKIHLTLNGQIKSSDGWFHELKDQCIS
jgi:hypothetical protein